MRRDKDSAIGLAKGRLLISQGWKLKWDRNPDGLTVWVEDGSGDYSYCRSHDFPALAAFERECRRAVTRHATRHVTVINSSAVYSYGYDRETEVFEVRFTDGGRPHTKGALYRWSGVPIETITAFELSKSKGAFLACTDRFRGRYQGGRVDESTPLDGTGFARTVDAQHAGGVA